MVTFSRRLSRVLAAGAALGLTALGVHPANASNDPLSDKQWSLVQANVRAAWPVTTGGGIKIGIVDSGVNRNHEDLRDRVVESATCTDTGGNAGACSAGSGAGNDVAGHGTHVSGIAAATMGNGAGVAGVAPGAQLVVARVFKPASGNSEPTATLDDVKAGIDWVVAHGAKVVNLSLGAAGGGLLGGLVGGGSNESSPLGPAVESAWNNGAIPVIAAGNGNDTLFGSNGSYGSLDAIVVGATIPSGAVASYSNGLTSGTKWGIVAPGGDNNGVAADMILSSFAGGDCQPSSAPNCYGYLSGTSMAAPMVSGAAALLLSQGLSREQVVQTLLSTADKVSCGSGCQGRLNVGRAVGVHASGGGGGGTNTTTGGNGTTGTTGGSRKKSATATTVAQPPATVESTTTTGVPADVTPPEETTTTREHRHAIALSTGKADDGGVPVAAGAAGAVLLAGAAVSTAVRIRRMRSLVS
ncbi:MAG: hypothetical protein QOJ00_2183 [Actinomycetota bacterium]